MKTFSVLVYIKALAFGVSQIESLVPATITVQAESETEAMQIAASHATFGGYRHG